jgi:hypothetical protein
VALVQERLVRLIPANDRLRAFTCPFYTSPIHEAMWWHPADEDDAAHRWFRAQISAVTAPLRRSGGSVATRARSDPAPRAEA